MVYLECTHYPHASGVTSIEIISEQIFPIFILTLIIYTVVQASDIPRPIISRHYTFVEIITGNDSRRTRSIKLNKNACTRWDAHFVLCVFIHLMDMPNSHRLHSSPLDGSSKISFSVFHDSLFNNECLGKIEISVRELLELQIQQAGRGEFFLFFFNGSLY
jgi:hypothetical protein